MAAPRATQFIALRNLARGSHQARQLHMTGPATYASPIITKERPLQLPRDIAGLRAECKKRNLEIAGSEKDLISRLEADVLSHNRAFTTLAHNRPTPPSTAQNSSNPTRDFNTSRTLKSVNDSSPIDFAYFPAISTASPTDLSSPMLRVPILPTTTTPAIPPIEEIEETVVVKPQISTMSMDRVFLPVSEITDGDGTGIDFHAMAARVGDGMKKMKVPVEEQAGLMKRIWSDMVDDMFAVKKNAATAA